MDNSEGMAEVVVFNEFVITFVLLCCHQVWFIKDSLNCLSSLVVLLLLGCGQCALDVSSLIYYLWPLSLCFIIIYYDLVSPNGRFSTWYLWRWLDSWLVVRENRNVEFHWLYSYYLIYRVRWALRKLQIVWSYLYLQKTNVTVVILFV